MAMAMSSCLVIISPTPEAWALRGSHSHQRNIPFSLAAKSSWRRVFRVAPGAPARRRAGLSSATAVWKQDVLFAESPVLEVSEAAPDLFHLALDISGSPDLAQGYTKPGQFVQLRVGDSKPAFMAIASTPKSASAGFFEFLVKNVEGQTAGLLCSLRKGDKVDMSQVIGNGFALDQISPPQDFPTLLLFCTGSGIGPIRALIEYGFDAQKRQDVRLYYGARNLQRMAYQDKFEYWESVGVKVVPVLSQPTDDWNGERGYVQAAFSKAKDIASPNQTGAILCGQKGMVQDVTSLLVGEGVLGDKILTNF